jgi:hypothetical protein
MFPLLQHIDDVKLVFRKNLRETVRLFDFVRGLFVGAIVLSVGYKLFVAWIEPDTVEEQSA